MQFSSKYFISHFRKDVRLPVHLQRAMAAEAEAAREARAKVTSMEGRREGGLVGWKFPLLERCHQSFWQDENGDRLSIFKIPLPQL